jgi:hypothetical protein
VHTQMLALTRAGDDFFLAGAVPDAVAAAKIAFADGRTTHVKVDQSFVLYAIPGAEAADGRGHGLRSRSRCERSRDRKTRAGG